MNKDLNRLQNFVDQMKATSSLNEKKVIIGVQKVKKRKQKRPDPAFETSLASPSPSAQVETATSTL